MALELASTATHPEKALVAFALRVAALWTSEREIGLYRLISSEAVRFPQLAEIYRETMRSFRATLADYLSLQCDRGVLAIDDIEATTRLFSLMTIGEIREETLFGSPPSVSQIDVMVRRGVRLFLDGCWKR